MNFKFPKDFLWGAASSAMQIEAVCDADGQAQSVVDYYSSREVARSIQAGADIKGYYVWTFLDTYEINDSAYDNVFGLVQVDWDTLKRTPRKSFYYYQNIIKNNTVD